MGRSPRSLPSPRRTAVRMLTRTTTNRLKRLVKREDNEQMRVFKAELRQALTDPSQLPAGELDNAVEYDDGSDEKFLRRLWHDLYGDEPTDLTGF